MYDDKVATLARIKKTITEILPKHVRDRLVLENDEVHLSIPLPLMVLNHFTFPAVLQC